MVSRSISVVTLTMKVNVWIMPQERYKFDIFSQYFNLVLHFYCLNTSDSSKFETGMMTCVMMVLKKFQKLHYLNFKCVFQRKSLSQGRKKPKFLHCHTVPQ